MTDRAGSEGLRPHDSTPEAPERVHSAAEEWERALVALALEVPSEVFRGVADKAVAWLGELKVFAAQERDAAVAAALEEAMAAVLAPPEADTLAAASEIARASERVEALPRNDTALRQHEVKLLRENGKQLENARYRLAEMRAVVDALGPKHTYEDCALAVNAIHRLTRSVVPLEEVSASYSVPSINARDEAARRKETTPAARTGSPSPQGAQSSRGIAE